MKPPPITVYHGTTRRRALRIRIEGFRPGKKSRRVWFAENRDMAAHRAEHQAYVAHDRPVILTCRLDLEHLRRVYGPARVHYKHRCVAVDGPLPVSVLRHCPVGPDQPVTPSELSDWVSRLLPVKRHKGPGRHHPGILRLSRWVKQRLQHQPDAEIPQADLVAKAQAFIPEFFEGFVIDPRRLRAERKTEIVPEPAPLEPAGGQLDAAEEQALADIMSTRPSARVRGLERLSDLGAPDLFDWCVMHLGDASVDVRVAALHTMLRCPRADLAVVRPLAEDREQHVRAAALAVMIRHSEKKAADWMVVALRDPSPHVRLEASTLLDRLDPSVDRRVFELARHDPNPDIIRRAEHLVAGKGYTKAYTL